MPGLTGLWQVSGKNRTTFDEMIRLDIQYAENLSLPLDLKIIALTVPALLLQLRDTGKGLKVSPQTERSEQARV
jgi:lipopolysaccharide/colanic/teichoic acid biosynthesis glycosyltransferase